MEPTRTQVEAAQFAARLIVEEGLDYASARQAAFEELGITGPRGGRSRETLPNELIEDEVRAHIALFCADTQPAELLELRRCARYWMQRLAEFRPHLGGAVWRGTATALSDVRIDLFCDDSKAPEIALLGWGVDFDCRSAALGEDEHALVYTLHERSRVLREGITLHLSIFDHDALRGALKPDSRGHSWRGDLAALDRLLASSAAAADPADS